MHPGELLCAGVEARLPVAAHDLQNLISRRGRGPARVGVHPQCADPVRHPGCAELDHNVITGTVQDVGVGEPLGRARP